MKKYLIILLLLLTGCTKSIKLNINPINITNIVYEDKYITSNDYISISDEINNKLLYELYDNTITGEKLVINTKDTTYNFEIVDKYIIYTVDKHRYFTSTNNLDILLTKIVDK